MQIIRKIEWILAKIETAIVTGGLAAMGILLFLQVMFRYLFNMPLKWSEELARYIFAWVVFVGLSYGIREGAHIRVQLVSNHIPSGLRRAAASMISLVMAAMFALLTPAALEFAQRSGELAPSTRIPMSYVYFCMPLGFAMSAIRLLLAAFLRAAGREREL